MTISSPWHYNRLPLNSVDGDFTVAPWVKPETDYIDGASWRWSFGRDGLWKLGFYGPDEGVRFEVKDGSDNLHAIHAVHPLYTGRWVHLAAAMRSGATWTNLSLFVNGGLAAWTNGTAFAAKDGNSYLYLGYDEAAGGRFTGIVDEVRLYKAGLSSDAVKFLMWFLHGANSVVVPRGVFYSSDLFQAMNGSWDPDSPLSNATIHGTTTTSPPASTTAGCAG